MIEIDMPKPYQPTTKDLLDFAQTCGLVEEKENFILLALSTLNKVSCGVESVSGSGKSVLTDILMMLIDPSRVYRLGLTSNTATVYDYEAVNSADILYVEELQKALNNNNPIMVEVLKNITEGKNITRTVYDSTMKQNIKQTISGNLGLVYSLALENKTKKDDELDRRVITFMTDISQQQNRRVLKYIGKTRFKKSRLKIQTDKTTEQLKQHVNMVLDLAKERVENPFSEFIAEKVPVPFVKVRSYITHYFNLMESCTKYHYKERPKYENMYFTTLQDVFAIHKLYGKMFNQKIHNLPQLGIEIMELFDIERAEKLGWKKNTEREQQALFVDEEGKDKVYLDVTKIHKELKKVGLLLKYKLIRDQCEELVEAGFLGKEQSGKRDFYFKTDEVEEFEDSFDFPNCLQAGIKNMKESYPKHYEDWLNLQMDEKGRFPLYHPITGETIYLDELKIIKKEEKPKEEKLKPGTLVVTEEAIEK
jgi:predicted transcriptional regulator